MKFDCEMPPIYEYKAEQCGPQTVLKKCKIDPREDGFLQHVLRLFIPTTDPTLGSFIEIWLPHGFVYVWNPQVF